MRLLFITSTRLGDAVLSTGLLDHLLRRYPDLATTIACGPVAAGLFERMPGRVETIILRKRGYARHWLELWRRCVGRRWDMVIDLRASAFSYVVWAGARHVAKGGRRPGHRLGHLGALLGLNPPPLPKLWWNAEDEAAARALLPAEPWIALAPTANWDRKIWPEERFRAVFAELTAPDGLLPGARPVVFGGPGEAEQEMAAPVLRGLPGAVDLVGKLSLPQAGAALSRAALFVGNDSGLMHLAAAAGAPTLGLFGPTPASEYGPSGPCAQAVLADGPPGAAAMEDLPVATVLEAARVLLAGKVAA